MAAGGIGFFESLCDVEVLQHRVFVVLIAAFAFFEWGVRTGRLRRPGAALVLPLVTALGAALLLTHSHTIGNVKEQLLIELTPTPLALAGVGALAGGAPARARGAGDGLGVAGVLPGRGGDAAVVPGGIGPARAGGFSVVLTLVAAQWPGSRRRSAVPSELRHLLFRPAEVVRAVKEYHRRAGAPLPPGAVVRCGPETEGTGVRFRITLVPDQGKSPAPSCPAEGNEYDLVIEGPALAAALILHCRDRHIPLPAIAEKSLTRFGEQTCLVATINPKRCELPQPGQLRL